MSQYATVSLVVTSPVTKTLSTSVDLDQLKIINQPNGLVIGIANLLLQDEGRTYAHVKLWSYWFQKKIWHEVLISNSLIEDVAGYF